VTVPRIRAGCAALACLARLAAADPPVVAADPANGPGVPPGPVRYDYKLTAGYYDFRGFAGQDVNLRRRRDDTSVWVGWYRDPVFGAQGRVGWDTSVQPFPGVALALQPSVQLASRDFVGGSLNAQIGTAWYALVGIGRTDLRPYVNLNFDPNDAITLGAGHQSDDGPSYGVLWVADDRLGTKQRHLHGTWRLPLTGDERLTVDILRKQGLGDTGYVRAWGGTATYEFPRWFVRTAYDPKQNFSRYDVIRLSAGIRF
jgi:hypothetical protein